MTNTEIIKKLEDIFLDLQIQFNLKLKSNLNIVISNRLKSSNGHILWDRSIFTKEIYNVKIVMSKAVLDTFGWERFEKTFRHEVAHLANHLLYGGENHDSSFKKLCKDFGGSMNTSMAGYQYSECADNRFVKPDIKYIYNCTGCGYKKKMSKRMANKKRGSSFYLCRVCKTPLSKWEEIKV